MSFERFPITNDTDELLPDDLAGCEHARTEYSKALGVTFCLDCGRVMPPRFYTPAGHAHRATKGETE